MSTNARPMDSFKRYGEERMTKTFCDYCGKETKIGKEIVAELDEDHFVHIDIKPKKMNSDKDGDISSPDLCADCIVKAINKRH